MVGRCRCGERVGTIEQRMVDSAVGGVVQVQRRRLRQHFAVGGGLAVVFQAGQQRMLQPACAEFGLGLIVDVEAAVVELEDAGIAADRRHGGIAGVQPAAPDRAVVQLRVHQAHVLAQRPGRVGLVLEGIAQRPLLLAVVVEVRLAGVHIARDAAVGIVQHHALGRQEVAGDVAAVVQVGGRQRQRRRRAGLPAQRRGEGDAAVLGAGLRIAVAAHADQTVGQRAVAVGGVADVERQLLARVVADLDLDLADAVAVGQLALHVDDGAGIALAVQHRGRPRSTVMLSMV